MNSTRAWALDQLGRTLGGRYRLEELRGLGGMGAVFVARHLELDAPVALKLLLPERASGAAADALRGEARRAASVGGRGVAQVTDFGVDDDGDPFLVMELLDGETLAERVSRRGSLAPADAVRIVDEALRVIARVHEGGLVHGDLKPSNLFLVDDEDGEQVTLLDFGIARLIEKSDGDAYRKLRGTPAFMAPEQLEGPGDERSDLYAAGACLYHALAGRRPYAGHSGDEVLEALAGGPPTPLAALRPSLSGAIVAVVERAMQRAPEQRYRDAGAFRAALAEAMATNAEADHDEDADRDEDATLDAPVALGRAAHARTIDERDDDERDDDDRDSGERDDDERDDDGRDDDDDGNRRDRGRAALDAPAPSSDGRRLTPLALGALAVVVVASGVYLAREEPDRQVTDSEVVDRALTPASTASVEVAAAPPISIEPTVLAPWTDGHFYPATVVERLDGRARVLFADGDQTVLEENALRPDGIAVGSCVRAKASTTSVRRVCVRRREGFAVMLADEDGRTFWTTLRRIGLVEAPSEGATYTPSPVTPGELGSEVVADFQGRGRYFPAVIVDRGPRAELLLVYADGDQEWTQAARVRLDPIGIGDTIEVGMRRAGQLAPTPGRVENRVGDALWVRFTEGPARWVPLASVSLARAAP